MSLVWLLACSRDPRRIHSTDVVAQKGNPMCRRHAGNKYLYRLVFEAVYEHANNLQNDRAIRRLMARNILQKVGRRGGRIIGRTKWKTWKVVGENLMVPYGHLIHPADGVMNKANRDKASIDSTNDTKATVSSSGANGDDDDDDDDDPFNRKLRNGGCDEDESLPGDSDDDHDDEENDDIENGFSGEAVEPNANGEVDHFPNVVLDDDDMDVDEEEKEEEAMTGLWEE